MKTTGLDLNLRLGVALVALALQPLLAQTAGDGRSPSQPAGDPLPILRRPEIVLSAQLNGQNELPPNESPLYAGARFTLRPYLLRLPGPIPFPTNYPAPIPTNGYPLPPLPITNVPPIVIYPPPVLPSNPPPVILPGGIGEGTPAAVAQSGGYPGPPGPFPPGTPDDTTNYLQGYVVFPLAAATNELGLTPGAASLEDEAGNAISGLVGFGNTPIGVYTGNLDENGVFPISGGFMLTREQKADLLAGHWFVRVQALTSSGQEYPAGTIRGRLVPVDSDGDGVPDYLDFCPGTEAGEVVDTNGCSVAQHCPWLGPWQNHGDYVTCVQSTAASFVRQGLLSAQDSAALVRQAARSDAGRRLTPAAPHSGISGQSVLYLGGAFGAVPYPTSFRLLSESGMPLTESRTDFEGRFQVNLPPGVYTLVPWLPPPPESGPGAVVYYPWADPVTVTVQFKQFTNVVITYTFENW